MHHKIEFLERIVHCHGTSVVDYTENDINIKWNGATFLCKVSDVEKPLKQMPLTIQQEAYGYLKTFLKEDT